MNNLTETEIAYIAGLLDGEGTFTITEMKRQKYPSYVFTEVYITNSNIDVMHWLAKRINGKIRISRNGKKGWKDVYKFFILQKEREEFIKTIHPYLVIKKKQANIVLKLLALIKKQKANIRGSGGLTEKEWKQRHRLALQIRQFNKRGVDKIKFSTLRD